MKEFRVADVNAWLRGRKPHLSTRSLRLIHNLLERAIRYAQVQEMVARNVATLATVPRGGRPGQPSKSLPRDQAVAVLNAAKQFPRRNAYTVPSLTSGVRTEEIGD